MLQDPCMLKANSLRSEVVKHARCSFCIFASVQLKLTIGSGSTVCKSGEKRICGVLGGTVFLLLVVLLDR